MGAGLTLTVKFMVKIITLKKRLWLKATQNEGSWITTFKETEIKTNPKNDNKMYIFFVKKGLSRQKQGMAELKLIWLNMTRFCHFQAIR